MLGLLPTNLYRAEGTVDIDSTHGIMHVHRAPSAACATCAGTPSRRGTRQRVMIALPGPKPMSPLGDHVGHVQEVPMVPLNITRTGNC
jgi:hypothetical protein